MRRVLILILCVLVMIPLISCGFEDVLSLEGYSNVNEEDVPIINAVSSRFDYSLTQYDKPMEENFVTKIDNIKGLTHSFYSVHINTESLYYICGYGNKIFSTMMYMTFGDYANFYSWYKVDDLKNIRQEVNNKELLHVFAVYDATIEKNLVNGQKYDYETKYYSKQNEKEIDAHVPLSESYILCLQNYLMEQEIMPYINSSLLNGAYSMYIDEKGVEYLSFLHEYYNESDFSVQNYSKDLFLDYYDTLCNGFVPLDNLSEEFYYNDQRIIKRYFGIEMRNIVDLIID